MGQYTSAGIQQAYKGIDFRGTPGLHIPVSGGVASKPTTYSELSTFATNLTTAYTGADTVLQGEVDGLQTQLNNLQLGVREQIAVAVLIDTLAAANSHIAAYVADPQNPHASVNGLNLAATAEDPSGWYFIKTANGSGSGIYHWNGSTSVRVDKFNTPASLKAGLMIYVDKATHANTFWLLRDDAIESGGIISADFIPFGRLQDLAVGNDGASLLHYSNNHIQAKTDPTFFATGVGPNSGDLPYMTFSAAFLSRITGIETVNTNQASEFAALDSRLDATEADIQSTQSRLETVDENISDLQSGDIAIDTRIDALESAVEARIFRVTARFQTVPTTEPEFVDTTAAPNNPAGWYMVDATVATSGIYRWNGSSSVRVHAANSYRVGDLISLTDSFTHEYYKVITSTTGPTFTKLIDLSGIQGGLTTTQSELAALDYRVEVLEEEQVEEIEVTDTIAQFYKDTHKIVSLTNGIYSAGSGTTTFYVDPGFNDLDFALVRISEKDAPYEHVAEPKVEYVTEDANTNSGSFMKITFFGVTQVANNSVEAFVQRFFRPGSTPFVAFQAADGGGGS